VSVQGNELPVRAAQKYNSDMRNIYVKCLHHLYEFTRVARKLFTYVKAMTITKMSIP